MLRRGIIRSGRFPRPVRHRRRQGRRPWSTGISADLRKALGRDEEAKKKRPPGGGLFAVDFESLHHRDARLAAAEPDKAEKGEADAHHRPCGGLRHRGAEIAADTA
jgi:hypothetical protein